MPLFLDRHDDVTHTPEEVARLHACDMDAQAKFGVKYLTYWYQHGKPEAFCLVEAPSKQAAEAVHREAHGNMPSQIIEVERRDVEVFLGPIREPERGEAWEDVSFRGVLTTAFAGGPVSRTRGPGRFVGHMFDDRGGRQVAAEDGAMVGRFHTVSAALECALAIQQSFSPLATVFQHSQVQAKTGIHSGEPVTKFLDLFGEAVLVSSRLSEMAEPGEILVSGEVRGLCKGYRFKDRGEEFVPGCERAVNVYRLEGRDSTWLGNPPTEIANASHGPIPAGLSPREVEVLRLISIGKTNQEIADTLVISLNTVATHVRNILEKTDSANRAEAACYALRKRLA